MSKVPVDTRMNTCPKTEMCDGYIIADISTYLPVGCNYYPGNFTGNHRES